MSAIPVILCGKTAQIAAGVTAGLKPEFNVISTLLSLPSAKSTIPSLLQTTPAKAVVCGGGYCAEDVGEMIKACEAGEGVRGVGWYRVDSTIPSPPLGPAYGKAVVDRFKARFVEVEEKKEKVGDGHETFLF
ncbi:hypothetical protein GLAREA_02238 [Glarea lozoyensis ATCC 20868]|uniref:Uncharacterized protein n=1 Tax=Glarea lozoyensis (strain ATCC 20868 / MF5171) TaxID=1116229 RepID=S3D2R8_GLAL2|nr:uncharacterized protein GLAREA_02238 [Glarea lozoyensis ATCC 20868]EPE26326.1 hypothetical protein GLAREA_02238 [Glarea lozoyensis ATCC 20868]